MIAQNNESMTSAAESIFLSNQDYNIRKVIRERQEHERYIERLKADRDKANAERDEALKALADLQAQLNKSQEQDKKD
ncbi:MAG: hypothetical protein K6C96_01070 [Butyrivibrio sp.]|nr:hypothetical protein [Butyrivibrio sp.]